ncbi:hypothetical protein FRC17_002693 [Serendipita sp. 399]|nr:hypothetical protein FRC17_002693 [Serendipita sp. 399]
MRSLWDLAVLQALLVPLPALVGARDTVFVNPRVRVTTTFADFNDRFMDHWGNGGGDWAGISSKSKHPFKGRTFGGAKRREIRGTRAFGSGYPYGATRPHTVSGRPFPFGVWPLYWDQDFMNSAEYGSGHDIVRPGGFIALVPLRTTTEHFNVTDEEVYYAIGDRESLLPLMISYVTECHVTPVWPSRFDPSSPNATLKLENVFQYFRASSFALASPSYINAFGRTPNSELKESTPLPELMEYSPFRKCVDGVTEKALAIMNQIPKPTPVDYFGMALFMGGFLALILGLVFCVLFGNLRAVSLHKAQREAEMQYERYP